MPENTKYELALKALKGIKTYLEYTFPDRYKFNTVWYIVSEALNKIEETK
jgi:hypothetical protein